MSAAWVEAGPDARAGPDGGDVAGALDVLHVGRPRLRDRPAGAVALATRGLEHPRGGEADEEPAGRNGPGIPAREVLDVVQDRVAVLVLEIAADPLDSV